MKLTQGQVRNLTGLSEPTLRTWYKHVPRLRQLKGKGLNFTLGDVIALLVIQCATKRLGCPISLLAPKAAQLFEVCSRVTARSPRSMCVVFGQDTVSLLPDLAHLEAGPPDAPFIVVPLAPALSALDGWLNDGQLAMHF